MMLALPTWSKSAASPRKLEAMAAVASSSWFDTEASCRSRSEKKGRDASTDSRKLLTHT